MNSRHPTTPTPHNCLIASRKRAWLTLGPSWAGRAESRRAAQDCPAAPDQPQAMPAHTATKREAAALLSWEHRCLWMTQPHPTKRYAPQGGWQGSPCSVGRTGTASNVPGFPIFPNSDGFSRAGMRWVLEGGNFLPYIPGICGFAEQHSPWEAQHPWIL